ncbi:MAG: hypothetical protein QXU60_04220 [Sulfolobales archaeon]
MKEEVGVRDLLLRSSNHSSSLFSERFSRFYILSKLPPTATSVLYDIWYLIAFTTL